MCIKIHYTAGIKLISDSIAEKIFFPSGGIYKFNGDSRLIENN